MLKRRITLVPLVGIIFLTVSGGSYSLEELVSATGPGLAFLALLLVPIFYGIPVAAITTELSSAVPAEGGTYEWMRRTLGDFMAFQAGLLRWIGSWIDMAIYPVLFASYITAFFPNFFNNEQAVLFAAGPISIDMRWLIGVIFVIIPMAFLNIRGAKVVGDSSVIITIVSLIPLIIIALLGISNIVVNNINPFTPFIDTDVELGTAIVLGLSLLMWSYCGFDQIGLISGEVENPGKTIPKAMAISMVVIVLAYLLPLMGAMAVPVPSWQNWFAGSYVDIGIALGGNWLGIAVAIGGAISALGMYGSLLLSSSRVPFVLARDSWMTPKLARESKRHNSPIAAIIVSSAIYALFTMGSFTDLILLDVFLINLLLLLNFLALVLLRVREPGLDRPMRIPFGWFGVVLVGVPLVGGIGFLMYMQFTESELPSVLILLGTLTVSVLSYFPAKAYRNRRLTRFQVNA